MKTSLIFLFLLIWIADAKKETYKHTFSQPGESAELKCPDNEIIYNISLTSKNIKHNCYGLQVVTLVETLKCYWKNNCSITLGAEDIISQINGNSNMKCIGKKPDVMLYNFRCIPQDSVTHTIHNNDTNIDSSNGIIKSHNKYPWNYEAEPNTQYTVGSATIKRPKHKKILYLKYINYDVHFDDNVSITYNTTAAEKWDHGLKVIKNMKRVQLKFTVFPGTKFGGFLICYKWVRSTSATEERDFERNPCTQESIKDPTKGSITGPNELTIKRPCKKRKGCNKSWKNLKFVRFGIMELSGEIHYEFTTGRKKRKSKTQGYFDGRHPFKVKGRTLKRVKEIKIKVPANAKICFIWEARYNNKPVDCSQIGEDM